ncbi:MAG: hypothetical protein IJP17_03425, partial [Clostridia bacterium]|nr:hypothetical protein [Clostridia bacterium]
MRNCTISSAANSALSRKAIASVIMAVMLFFSTPMTVWAQSGANPYPADRAQIIALFDGEDAKRVAALTPDELEWYREGLIEYGIDVLDDGEYYRHKSDFSYAEYEKLLEAEAKKRRFEQSLALGTPSTICEEETYSSPIIAPFAASRMSTTKSPFTGGTYTHNSRFDGCQILSVVDVSSWQETINYTTLKNCGLVDAVIIRVGRRTWGSDGTIKLDTHF